MLNQLSIQQKLTLLVSFPTIVAFLLFIQILLSKYQMAQAGSHYGELTVVSLLFVFFIVATIMLYFWIALHIKHGIEKLRKVTASVIENHNDIDFSCSTRDETSVIMQQLQKIYQTLQETQELNEHAQRISEELRRVFAALAIGNLNESVKEDYAGELGKLKVDINNTVSRLNNAMTDIKAATDAAAQGILDKRIDLSNKQGFLHDLSSNLNKNLNDNQVMIEEVMRVFAAVSKGDLSQTMQQTYSGSLASLKQNVNSSVAQLNAVMSEIKVAIEAAANGIFDNRVDMASKDGFFKDLGQNLNNNLNVNQTMVEEVMRVFAAVSQGDLSQTMNDNYSGNLAQLKEDVNNSVRKLNDVMGEIQDVVEAAGQGIFDKRIESRGKEGFFLSISENLNLNLDTNQRMVEELMRVFSAMSSGNLNETMQDNYSGRLSELKVDVNETVSKLNSVMSEVGQAVGQVSIATAEVAQGSLSLSQRTEQQAAALEETASSMQEMTDTVRQNADNAQQANQLSMGARDNAEEGGNVITKTIQSMDEINKSSKQVADIIGVIDEIAFQTNLLALNAAVEAARAGEQGRGFAVVATEVRNLAQRSATSAKEIKSLIQNSVSKVEGGAVLVNQSGETLNEMTVSVKKVSDIIAEIAAASQEQSAGILQVNKAVTQMDEMTQQNAALVEELSTNSDSLREQIQMLQGLLGFFQFSEATQRHVTSAKKQPTKIETQPAVKKAASNNQAHHEPDAIWTDF